MKTQHRVRQPHKPGTKEIFLCLSYAVEWCKILSAAYKDKPYIEFLDWLIKRDFRKASERILINKIAGEFGKPSSIITKWLNNIYVDLFDLNEEHPELFRNNGIPVSLYFSHYDNNASFNLSVPCLPRHLEKVEFYFVKAKMEIDFFWVDKVEHLLGVDPSVIVWLKGGFPNRYREMLFDKAVFYERIRSWGMYDKYEFQIDDELRKLYKE